MAEEESDGSTFTLGDFLKSKNSPADEDGSPAGETGEDTGQG
jgi:hypothetical protein